MKKLRFYKNKKKSNKTSTLSLKNLDSRHYMMTSKYLIDQSQDCE